MNFSDVKYLATQTVKEWGEDDASRLAASLAYYTVFSIPPLLILFLVIAGQIYGDQAALRDQLTSQISGLVGPEGADAIESILENADNPSGTIIATVVSFATLIFGASGVFAQLHDTLNKIWNVEIKESNLIETVKERFFSFTMVLGVGFLLLVSLVISSGLAAFNDVVSNAMPSLILLAQIINFVVSFGVVTLLFALIFKIIPDAEIAWNDVWVGAVATALLFTIGKWGIGLYLGNSAPSSTYGAAGSLIVILLWVYYSAQILFFGAEFTQVYANKYGSGLQAEENAVLTQDAANTAVQDPIAEDDIRGWPTLESAVSAHHSRLRRPVTASTTTLSAELPPSLQKAEKGVASFQQGVVTLTSYVVAAWQLVKRITSSQ